MAIWKAGWQKTPAGLGIQAIDPIHSAGGTRIPSPPSSIAHRQHLAGADVARVAAPARAAGKERAGEQVNRTRWAGAATEAAEDEAGS